MTEISAVTATASVLEPPAGLAITAPAPTSAPLNFGEMLASGLQGLENKVDHANELVRAFAVDDSVPVHQVTIALEEARIAVELAMQIRTRLVEGYREIMNMQL